MCKKKFRDRQVLESKQQALNAAFTLSKICFDEGIAWGCLH